MELAHSVASDTEKAYQHGDLLEKSARLMAAWGDYCETLGKFERDAANVQISAGSQKHKQ
jgi:hypothetical protein